MTAAVPKRIADIKPDLIYAVQRARGFNCFVQRIHVIVFFAEADVAILLFQHLMHIRKLRHGGGYGRKAVKLRFKLIFRLL